MEIAPADTAAEANRLYWETELSVGEIAARLDLSRRALYDAIRPVPAEGSCGRCGGPLEYGNRSSRTHGFTTCANCGVQAPAPGTARADAEPWTWSPPARPGTELPAEPPALSVWWLGGAALGGALLGAAVTCFLVRRT